MDFSYISPDIMLSAFTCPHCKVFSSMSWSDIYYHYSRIIIPKVRVAHCVHCKEYSLWHDCLMVYPQNVLVAPPSLEIPTEICRDYLEAGNIVAHSPRGASAILRVAIEKLIDFVGAEGTDLNVKISYLVKKKHLNSKIQKSLDIVRVVGNNAVHPGVIDMKDNKTVAYALFELFNIIAQEMIVEPKRIGAMYDELVPEKNKADIVRRDRK